MHNKFCPNCESEYRYGFTKCADCGVDLVDSLTKADKFALLEEQELAVVGTGALDFIKHQYELLLKEQIASIYKPQSADECRSCVPTFNLLVKVEDSEKAISILGSQWKPEGDVEQNDIIDYNQENITCPACGFMFNPQETCPDCGLFIGIVKETE